MWNRLSSSPVPKHPMYAIGTYGQRSGSPAVSRGGGKSGRFGLSARITGRGGETENGATGKPLGNHRRNVRCGLRVSACILDAKREGGQERAHVSHSSRFMRPHQNGQSFLGLSLSSSRNTSFRVAESLARFEQTRTTPSPVFAGVFTRHRAARKHGT